MPTQSQDLKEVLKDPEFLGLSAPERLKVIRALDPEFAGLPEVEQVKALEGMLGVEPTLAPPPEAPPLQVPEALPPPPEPSIISAPPPEEPTKAQQAFASIGAGEPGETVAHRAIRAKYGIPTAEFRQAPLTREELQTPFVKSITGKSLTEWYEQAAGPPPTVEEELKREPTLFERATRARLGGFRPPPEERARGRVAVTGMARDSAKLAAGLLDFFGSPEGISAAAIAATGPLGAAGVAAFYATEQGIESKRAIEEWALDPWNPDKIQAALLAPGFTFLLAGGAGGAFRGHLEFKARLKTAWEKYNDTNPPKTKAEGAERLQAQEAGQPPPDVIPAEMVRMVEESQREAVEKGRVEPTPESGAEIPPPPEPTPAVLPPTFSRELYQGRGATPEQIYGTQAVKEGRAYPILGKGNYYAFTEGAAKVFGEVSKTHVSLDNPLRITSDSSWLSLLERADTPHLSSMSREFYTEPQRIPEMAEKLQTYLREQGYDGVVVDFDPLTDTGVRGGSTKRLGEMFGEPQVVKFPTTKVKKVPKEPVTRVPEELPPPPVPAEVAVERTRQVQEAQLSELQRGSLKIQGELPKEITKVNRAEDLLPIIEEGFASPSAAFRKVSRSAGEIVDRTIAATEAISRDTATGISEYERVWRPLRKKGLETAVIRLLDNPKVTPENLSIRVDPKVREAYISTRVLLDNMKERINSARETAGLPPITGITEGYFPHVFQGDWTITKQVGKEWQPIETGWLKPSQVEATNAARAYLEANPGTPLKVELNKLHMTGDQATALSRKSYFRLMNRLSKANELFIDPLTGEMIAGPMGAKVAKERLQGVARPTGKPAKRARFGHVKERKTDLTGWLEDPKALELLIRGAERYIKMTELRPEVAKLRERVDVEAPEASRLHRQLDSYIGAAIEGRVDGFTSSFNAAWEKTGEALGIVSRPAALQRVSRRINEAQSLLKLGFSPVSAFVNMTQTPLNTFPVLGAKYTMRGMRRYAEAYRDNFRGKSNPYWDVIEELNIPSQATKIEEAGMREHFRARLPRSAREVPAFAKEATLEIGLWPFRQAELANRGVASLGAYERAIDGGATHATAISEARSVLTRTQFQYGPADAPWVLRQAWTRVPGQFKTFQIKELEFILGLNKQEMARFIPSLITTTGVVGVPGAMLLDSAADALGIHIDGMTPLEYLRIEAGTADDSYLGRLQKLVVMGAPAAAGIDVIRNVGFQEFFSPAMFELRDLAGPTGNDLKNLLAWAPKAIASRVGPTLRGEIETAGELIEGLPSRERDEAFRTFISQLSPAARRVWGIQSSLAKEGDIRDPRTGKLIIGDLSKTERLLMVFGFTPMRVSSLRELERVYVKALMREQDIRNGFVDQLAQLQVQSLRQEEAGDVKSANESQERFDYLIDWADRMEVSRGLMSSVQSRVRTLERTAIERLERRTPRRVGPQEEQERLLKYAEELRPPPEEELKPPPEE